MRVEEWMRPNVPPDLLRVVDAVGLDQQLDEIFVLAPAGKIIRNIGARKFVEHLAAVGLQPGIHAQPERRIGRERQNVRQKIARVIHHVDRRLAILDSDVHVQAENQIGARHQLHVLDNILVALVGMNLLRAPVGKRMRRRRRQPQPILLRQPDHVAAQLLHFGLGFLNIVANPTSRPPPPTGASPPSPAPAGSSCPSPESRPECASADPASPDRWSDIPLRFRW